MPTGYTYKIEESDDFTFPDYIWGCARAFGALVEMRDEPSGVPIPEKIEPSRHHFDRVEEVKRRIDALAGMSRDEVVRRIAEEAEEVERENRESRERDAAVSARYAAMRRDVEAWEPPTVDHVNLKTFMLEQIDSSTKFMGCYQRDMPTSDPDAWLAAEMASAAEELKYHIKHRDQDIARADERNDWLEKLRESIPVGGRSPEPIGAGSGESWRSREAMI